MSKSFVKKSFSTIQAYNNYMEEPYMSICEELFRIINSNLKPSESKIWHAHPVWFIDENPIVGYSKQKRGIRLMFWSGKTFDESLLSVVGEKFQDASIFYNSVDEISAEDVVRWLSKSIEIQWDYKNVVKRKGELLRLK
jgi:hypothetical protein